MLFPIKVVDIELSRPLNTFEGLEGYMGLWGLVRLHGVPLGYVKAPISLGKCSAATLGKLILEDYSWAIVSQLLKNGLASPERAGDGTDKRSNPLAGSLAIETLVTLPPVDFLADYADALPLVTVAVCTRDRPEDMRRCLSAISQLDYPKLDILVVDNASKTEATQVLVEADYPQVRYIKEPRPGLDWARNRAILEAKGEIIAYTDDDVVVDAGWVRGLVQAFLESPDVMAVTGLVVPYELETEAQTLFEDYGGFGRGFQQKRYRLAPGQSLPWQWLGAGQFGTGANMAYRKSVFETVGYFDPALDVGTVTNGGGDLDMFVRVIRSGYTLVYEPTMLIRHRHRREYAQLKRQLSYNGSLYALWLKHAIAFPRQRMACLIVGLWWMFYWNIRRLIVATLHRTRFPRELILVELLGAFKGITAYPKAIKRAKEIVQQHGWQTDEPIPIPTGTSDHTADLQSLPSTAVAVRTIELSEPLQPLRGLAGYKSAQVFVSWKNSPLGSFFYFSHGQDIEKRTLCQQVVDHFVAKLLDPSQKNAWDSVWAKTVDSMTRHYGWVTTEDPTPIPDAVPVSVIVGTFDRPDDLRNCVHHLQSQQTHRPYEIVVVDNHPQSQLSTSVKAEFPNLVWVEEPRQGVAYARNAGINASKGDILITIDDDVTVPADWLEKLIAPMANPDVMVVAGNILPIELETESQQAFEFYGGLGRGFGAFTVDGQWYDLFPHKPSPVWDLGGTANAAFRSTIFSDPEIGLMDEALGPGMPSGVGEDSYLFYKVIKAGYKIAYEPKAFVWHRHRRTQAALRKQIYNYSKGHVAHNLTTWLKDSDWRGLAQVLLGLPLAHVYRIKEYLLRRSNYPISLILLEMRGNLAGPWSLWRSHVRVAKAGRSSPVLPKSVTSQSVAAPLRASGLSKESGLPLVSKS
ncbi:MAG: glycosyltransferase [Cyanobacteria bacterium J06623_4]